MGLGSVSTAKSWNRAYVLKKMRGKDFSELEGTCLSTHYLLSENDDGVALSLEELYWSLRDFFEWFTPDSDLFVIAGPTTLCSLALAHLLARFEEICAAVYKEGRYEYYVLSLNHQMGLEILSFPGAA